MKQSHVFLTVLLFLLPFNYIQSKPLLTKSKYLIATYDTNSDGAISPHTGSYQLIYDGEKNEENATESDYWIIKNISGDYYTFQNSESKKYIRYNATMTDRYALELVDALYPDNSTSFTLEHKQTNGTSYYVIRAVANSSKIWNKRTSLSEGVYPIGVYSGQGSANEMFVFYDSSGTAVSDDGKITVPQEATRTLGAFAPYMQSFKINGKTPVVDKLKKEFFVTLPKASMPATSLSCLLEFAMKDASDKLYIDGVEVVSGVNFSFNNVSSAQYFTFEIKKAGATRETAKLYFSSLPIVQIYTDANIGNVYSLAKISVNEPLKEGESEIVPTNIRNRGATSLGFPKKSFAINLRDSSGINSTDRTFFDFRNDNNWILDAMYVDPARMRNRVSFDLWNDFATKPYWADKEPKIINGTRGQFVEVFINEAYWGLYCMTEKIDRKQLKLKKLQQDISTGTPVYTQRGALVKATSWSTAVMFGYPYNGNSSIPNFNNNYINWSGYEYKYPDLDEGEPIAWDNFSAAAKTASSLYTNNTQFLSNMSATFDLPVYLDYYLFIELMLATDNHGKNTYTSIYDQTVSPKVSVTPWDIDGSWGIRWDGSKSITYPEQDFDTFLTNNEHGQFNLFMRMKQLDADTWKTVKLKERYQSLRGNYFSYTNLMQRFTNYADAMTKSGADVREKAKWGKPNLDIEMDFLANWIESRLNYLDIKYLGAPYTSEPKVETSIECAPNPVVDKLTVRGLNSNAEVVVCNMQGVVLQKSKALNGATEVEMKSYAPGVYIVKSGQYVMKIIKK